MKTKIVTILTAIIVVFSSCSDNDDNSNNSQNYYIKTKVNGEWAEYKYDAVATLPVNGNTLSGYAKAVPNQTFPSFDFEITDPTGIKVQNYTEPNNDMIFRLAIEGMVTYTSQNGDAEDFNINITEITSNHIKGTFSGTIFLAQSSNGTNFSLTEGEFFLKRQME